MKHRTERSCPHCGSMARERPCWWKGRGDYIGGKPCAEDRIEREFRNAFKRGWDEGRADYDRVGSLPHGDPVMLTWARGATPFPRADLPPMSIEIVEETQAERAARLPWPGDRKPTTEPMRGWELAVFVIVAFLLSSIVIAAAGFLVFSVFKVFPL